MTPIANVVFAAAVGVAAWLTWVLVSWAGRAALLAGRRIVAGLRLPTMRSAARR